MTTVESCFQSLSLIVAGIDVEGVIPYSLHTLFLPPDSFSATLSMPRAYSSHTSFLPLFPAGERFARGQARIAAGSPRAPAAEPA